MVESGLAHSWRVLRRNLWIVVLVAAVAGAATAYFSSREPKLYRSSAEVFLGNGADISSQTPQEDPIRVAATQARLARTVAVARAALRDAGLGSRGTASLLGNSSVAPAANADLLTFVVEDHSADIATRLAASYAKAYTRYRNQLRAASIGRALSGIATQLDQLRSAGLAKTTAYADLLDEQQQLKTQQILQASNALLAGPSAKAAQIQPRPVRNTAIAAVLGLVLGVALAVLREGLNTRVRTMSEVEFRLDLPQLGRLSTPPRRFRNRKRLVMLDEPQVATSEAYRVLAVNLDFVNLERGARTIMVTSATRGEGKSTTIANLAVALARTGRRISLIDLDLRKPTLDTLFGIPARPGLTSVVLGRSELAQALVDVPLTGSLLRARGADREMLGRLSVLPVGVLPPNPAEFNGSDALASILAALRDMSDLVLVDAPPIIGISDAMTLSGRVDGLVVVTRLSQLKRSLLQELRRVLDVAPTAKLGFVVTDSPEDVDSYGYGYRDGHRGVETDAPHRESIPG
jgi:tyrosine-protein kinase